MKENSKNYFPFVLLGAYLLECIILGISPYDRTIWLSENIVAWVPIIVICLMYRCGIRFSNTAYFVMWLFFMMHTIGGHYNFGRVPFGFITDLFGFERNNFDRVCHFLVGVFAYPTLEYLEKHSLMRGRGVAVFFTVMSMFGFAAVFELIEWAYAVFATPEAGNEFLGMQGDIWDTQKDMLCDGSGAVVFSALYCFLNIKRVPADRTSQEKAL